MTLAHSQTSPVLVTGATGNVGREVVRALQARGIPVRAGDRRPERSAALFGAGVTAVRLDFDDPATFATAAAGCRAVFLLRPPAISNVRSTLIPFVAESRRVGVIHVVFLSVAGAGSNPLVPHHTVEAYLAASTGNWTVLRPGFFAQNLGDAYRRDIVEDDRVYLPAGSGRVAFVDVADVADVAAIVLASPAEHRRIVHELTGAAALPFSDVADLLSQALGRSIRYVPASILGYALHLQRRGLPAAQILVQTLLHVAMRWGQAARIDPTLGTLLGRSPRTVADYIRDHAVLWQRATAPHHR